MYILLVKNTKGHSFEYNEVLLYFFCSQDVWTAMHNDKEFVGKYMKPLYIGEVAVQVACCQELVL